MTITMMTRNSLFALLRLDLPQVKLKLLALQDVSVGSAALAGSGGDGSEDTAWDTKRVCKDFHNNIKVNNISLTGGELVSQSLVDLGLLLPLGVLLQGGLGPLLVEDGLLGVSELSALLTTKGQSVVRLVPEQKIGDKRKWRQPAVYSSPHVISTLTITGRIFTG